MEPDQHLYGLRMIYLSIYNETHYKKHRPGAPAQLICMQYTTRIKERKEDKERRDYEKKGEET